MVLQGDRVFVADGPGGLRVVDVSDPAAPRIVGAVPTPGVTLGAIAVGLSILAHFLISVASCLGLAALGLEFSIVAIATVTPLLIFLRFLPLTPLGLGVTDFAGEELFLIVGIDGGAEVQMLLRAMWVVVLIACGAAYFGGRRDLPAMREDPVQTIPEK